jgi:ferric-dicitrate binding protein FerR (iron transport regulator)
MRDPANVMKYDDETILRYLDGRLDGSTTECVREQILNSPSFAARVVELAEGEVLLRSVLLQEDVAKRVDYERVSSGRRVARRRPFVLSALVFASAAVAAAAAVLLPVLLRANARPQVPRIVTARGSVVLRDRDGRKVHLVPRLAVADGFVLECWSDGNALLQYPDGTSVEATAGTVLKAGASTSGKRLALQRGTMIADVTPQGAGKAMRVATPFAEAMVLGTRFVLAVAENGAQLEVSHGIVEFSRSESAVYVVDGECALATPQEELLIAPAPDISPSRRDGRRPNARNRDWKSAAALRRGKGIRLAGDVDEVHVAERAITIALPDHTSRKVVLADGARVNVRGSSYGELAPGDRVVVRLVENGGDTVREVSAVRLPGQRGKQWSNKEPSRR